MSANGFVDLRSDTVTMPTEQMRRAMANAELGDDCYGEDPTVNRLQELACEVLGCEAALYVPSGSMANQIAVRVLSSPGGEVICEADCHLIHHEAGACALLSQVQLRGLPSDGGILDPAEVKSALRADDPYQPRSVLVAIENTHNAAGGSVWSFDHLETVASVARDARLPIFCDGARLFNACVAAGHAASEYASQCDLTTISLYKGLAAPMGSLIGGSRELIDESWRFRRIFGGALRQAGVVAAAGVIALTDMVDRLADDHANARRLGEGLAVEAPDGTIPLDRLDTNMAVFDAVAAGLEPKRVLGALRNEGVLAGSIIWHGRDVVRFVTHKDVGREDIDHAIAAFARVLKELKRT